MINRIDIVPAHDHLDRPLFLGTKTNSRYGRFRIHIASILKLARVGPIYIGLH